MSRIFWDTNLFIYLTEEHKELSTRVSKLAERMLERNDQLLTSALTLGEVLVRPTARNDVALCRKYEDIISRSAILIPFERETARIYASIRGDLTIKAPDAIQLACAAQAHIDLFITNDERLSNKTIAGIQFIVSLRSAFL